MVNIEHVDLKKWADGLKPACRDGHIAEWDGSIKWCPRCGRIMEGCLTIHPGDLVRVYSQRIVQLGNRLYVSPHKAIRWSKIEQRVGREPETHAACGEI